MYHRVSPVSVFDQLTVTPGRFETQMRALAESARVLTLAQAVAELSSGGRLKPGVVVTFDDGYLDNLSCALPILEKYQIPACIFVTANFAEQTHAHPRYPDSGSRLHLDRDDIRRLAGHRLVTIGSHTISHPYLQQVPAEQCRSEIAGSRALISRMTGKPVDFFCYPSGDLGSREVALVTEAGYAAAVTVAPGVNRIGARLMQLRRTEITDRDDAVLFRAKLAGAFDFLHSLLHIRRRLRFSAAASGIASNQ
jgi:peptidoglycan/xylan/chitin deacetylase (PgdA/CDA1 family)